MELIATKYRILFPATRLLPILVVDHIGRHAVVRRHGTAASIVGHFVYFIQSQIRHIRALHHLPRRQQLLPVGLLSLHHVYRLDVAA